MKRPTKDVEMALLRLQRSKADLICTGRYDGSIEGDLLAVFRYIEILRSPQSRSGSGATSGEK